MNRESLSSMMALCFIVPTRMMQFLDRDTMVVSRVVLYTRYPIVGRALGLAAAFRPSACIRDTLSSRARLA